MERNENTGSIPEKPETPAAVSGNNVPGEQPVTVAGGSLGPLETAIKNSEDEKS